MIYLIVYFIVVCYCQPNGATIYSVDFLGLSCSCHGDSHSSKLPPSSSYQAHLHIYVYLILHRAEIGIMPEQDSYVARLRSPKHDMSTPQARNIAPKERDAGGIQPPRPS